MYVGKKDWLFDVEQPDVRTACRDVETGGRLLDIPVKWNTHWLKM
jgi:hypothetical protein